MTEPENSRRGPSFVSVLTIGALLTMFAVLMLPQCMKARETTRQNTCREHLTKLATALIVYDARNGKYPGYMNCLITQQGNAYVDPQTRKPAPVSWVVELLSDLDEKSLYEQWRRDLDAPVAGGSGPNPAVSAKFIPNTNVFLEVLICPSDDARRRKGTPLSYVANTGLRDLPNATPALTGSGATTSATIGTPRDWQANGMFFDNFSDDKLIKPKATTRGPSIVMRSGQVRDPKDKTILFQENLDATSYVFDEKDFPDGTPALTEIVWGSNWAPGKIVNPEAQSPTMEVPDTIYGLNAHRNDRPHPLDYKYCRASSNHPDGFNVAFVGKNVSFMRDTISYYVYAKMMASDDYAAKLPGTQTLLDQRIRGYQITEGEINP